MRYQIELSNTARKFLKKLSKKEALSVVTTLQSLALNPRSDGVVKMSNRDNEYRVKAGIYSQYRVVYTIEDKKVLIYVITIADRKDVYKKN
jgi:mRNA interferase RelE/StbE